MSVIPADLASVARLACDDIMAEHGIDVERGRAYLAVALEYRDEFERMIDLINHMIETVDGDVLARLAAFAKENSA